MARNDLSKATDSARARDAARVATSSIVTDPTPTTETALVINGGSRSDEQRLALATALTGGEMVGKMTPELASALAEAGDEIQWSPAFVTIVPGMVVRGYIVGQSKTDVEDQATRELKPVPTWILSDGHGRSIQFLSTHQLESDLNKIVANGVVEPRIGEYVVIARLDDEKTSKGRMVGRFQIGWPKNVKPLPGIARGERAQ